MHVIVYVDDRDQLKVSGPYNSNSHAHIELKRLTRAFGEPPAKDSYAIVQVDPPGLCQKQKPGRKSRSGARQ